MRGVNAILVATAILLRVSIGNCQVSESLPPLNLGAGVQLSGLLDTYYSLNDNHPGNDVNTYHNFDGYNSSLRLNVAEMGFRGIRTRLGSRSMRVWVTSTLL